ncbi:MAG: SDR family NAD(P)-dependent oxidoreductase, partial [Owenweeksia sp.]
MGYFTGKTVWITGASSGIGEALALKLSNEGTNLILSARRKEELERVKRACSNPDRVVILPLDLEENSKADQWTTEAWQSFGSIDILVNNGGIGQFGKVLDTHESVERKLFEINYFGNVALAKSVLPKMIANGKGQIMAISSIAGKFGQPNLAAYSASKGALTLYYESLKEELIQAPVKIQVV